jgi:tetratricopeptide (TPR) repeat protein
MIAFFGAVRTLHDTLNALSCYAALNTGDIPAVAITPQQWDRVSDILSRHDDSTFKLACLLLGNRAGVFDALSPPEAERSFMELARFTIRFGLYEVALHAAHSAARLTPTDGIRRTARLLVAKAHRGLGEYEQALRVYRDLLNESQNDETWVPRMLLQIGKVTHHSHWRTGYYREMVLEAKLRLEARRSLRPGDQQVLHSLGICYDSLAWIVLERAGEDLESVLHRASAYLTTAVQLAHDAGELSLTRRSLRLYYVEFLAAKTDDAQRAACAAFHEQLQCLSHDVYDPRGLGVRYGQLADMNLRMGRGDAALEAIHLSRRYAALVSDRRTLARGWIRTAEIRSSQGAPAEECLHCLNEARRAVGELGGQHPEIDLDIKRRESRFLRNAGDYERGRESLSNAIEILEKLERRVIRDYERHTDPSFCPSERKVLSAESWARLGNALVVDYQLVSQLQRAFLRESTAVEQRGIRREGIRTQLSFLAEYQLGCQHRLKNLLSLLNDCISREDRAGSGVDPRDHSDVRNMLELVTAWNEETQRDLDLLRSHNEDWVSVGEVVRALSLPTEEAADRELRFLRGVVLDFQLKSLKPLLRQALTHLVENAARVLRDHDGPQRLIAVRVAVDGNEIEGYVCRIEVEDSAGQTDTLTDAIDRINGNLPAHGSRPVSGLLLVHRFFERFHSRLSAHKTESGTTKLVIQMRHDNQRVRVVDRIDPRPPGGA